MEVRDPNNPKHLTPEATAKFKAFFKRDPWLFKDPLMFMMGKYSIDPDKFERFLISQGYSRLSDLESMMDFIIRKYGQEAWELIEAMI